MSNYKFMFPRISKVIICKFSVTQTKLSENVVRLRASSRVTILYTAIVSNFLCVRPTQSTITPNLLCTSWNGQGLYVRPVGFVLGSDLAVFKRWEVWLRFLSMRQVRNNIL